MQDQIEKNKIDIYEKSLNRIEKNEDYFEVLNNLSIRLQYRVANIVKILIFNEDNSNKKLIKATNHFKEKDGQINHKTPVEFLKENEKGCFKTSLYKDLLFIHIADAIKSGELNLKYSYRYLSINEYLIDETTWDKNVSNSCKLTNPNN